MRIVCLSLVRRRIPRWSKHFEVTLKSMARSCFSIDFCSPLPGTLCKSTTVGAFFGTAGTALVLVTPQSAESRYMPNELAAALQLKANERGLLLMTPKDALNAVATGVRYRVAGALTEDGS